MGTFFKGKSDFVNQSLTKRWTDLIKNSNFINAITGVSNSKHLFPVLNEYPIKDKNKAGQMFIYNGRLWHYMTKEQINDIGWSDIVNEGFPAPIDKIFDNFLLYTNFPNYSTSVSGVFPNHYVSTDFPNVIVDFLGYGKPDLLSQVYIGVAFISTNSIITKIRNAKFLVNLFDQGTNVCLNLGTFSYTLDALNDLVNDLPPTTNNASINLRQVANITAEHINILTNKGYTVII